MNITTPINLPLLNYQQIGEGQDIVLIHGLFGSLENLNMVAKVLSQHYKVTSVDVRNHGSSFHAHDMSYPALASDVFKLLDFLSISKCFLLGHSMGGKIAMQMALTSQNDDCNLTIQKLIVVDIAPVHYPPHHENIIKGLQSIDLSTVTNRREADKQLIDYVDNISVRQFLLRNLKSDSNGRFSFKCNLDNISDGYKQIVEAITLSNTSVLQQNNTSNSPFLGETLFIKGGNSDYILPQHKEAIAAILPNSKAKMIQGAGHWAHAEKTVAFNKIVIDFLKS